MNKASSIGRKELLGNWLYGVAYRVALRAKAKVAKRQEKEWQAADAAPSTSEFQPCDLKDVLDEELGKLADKYRLPLVLLFLQGMTKQKIAQMLGWPEGTVSSRLQRGKDQLRVRLSKRGVTATAAVFAAALAPAGVTAAIPTSLVDATLHLIQAAASTNALTAGTIPANVAQLAHAVSKPVLLARLLKAGILVLASCMFLGATGAAYLAMDRDDSPVAPIEHAVALPHRVLELTPNENAIPAVKKGPHLLTEIIYGEKYGDPILVTGKVANSSSGIHTVVFEDKHPKFGTVRTAGSVQTNLDGSFQWQDVDSSGSDTLFHVKTYGPDGLIVDMPDASVLLRYPRMVDFEAIRGKGDSWTFRGRLDASRPEDESGTTSVVENPAFFLQEVHFSFGVQALEGKTATVDADRRFTLTVDLPSTRFYTVFAYIGGLDNRARLG
jgi:hypothetical protein